MELHEILEALAEGKAVKYLNSHNLVGEYKGKIYSQYSVTGAKKELSEIDLDDCFI